MESITGVMVVFWILAVIIAILWILMPFAIFGTKPLLKTAERAKTPTNVVLVRTRKAEG